MRENPYKRLPPIERKPDGSLYRMTPAQRKQANALIRRECCCYEDGNCMLLDDGDTHTCPQTISFSVCCKWFRWSVLPQIGTLEAEVFREMALCQASLGDIKTALKRIDAAVRLDPSYTHIWVKGDLLYQNGSWSKALEAYEEVKEIIPENADIWTDMAACYKNTSQEKKEIAEYCGYKP